MGTGRQAARRERVTQRSRARAHTHIHTQTHKHANTHRPPSSPAVCLPACSHKARARTPLRPRAAKLDGAKQRGGCSAAAACARYCSSRRRLGPRASNSRRIPGTDMVRHNTAHDAARARRRRAADCRKACEPPRRRLKRRASHTRRIRNTGCAKYTAQSTRTQRRRTQSQRVASSGDRATMFQRRAP